MRHFIGFVLSVALLLSLCSCRVTIPQTVEDVDSFDDVLAFLAETTETAVEGITLDVIAVTFKEEPVVLSDADTNTLLTLLTEMDFTWEGYEPLEQYGAYSYALQIHLPEDKVVSLFVKEDYIHCCRQEKNAEGKWTDVPYRLVPTDTADTKAIYDMVVPLWQEVYGDHGGER